MILFRNKRNKTKKLAKKTLKNKWYPIRNGKKERYESGAGCCFCLEYDKKREPYDAGCSGCLIGKYKKEICGTIYSSITYEEVERIIKLLEKLAKKGKL